jgi:uncharacterized membrane protein YhaH (DUF805 family)
MYSAPWKKYSTFRGRASRGEYWGFTLINVVIYAVLFGLGAAMQSVVLYVVGGIFILATLLPALAVTVRRLHDINKGGGWFFITFVPSIGSIWLLILTLLPGTPGENRFGEKPSSSVVPATT